MHIIVCVAFLVCVLCQPVHSLINLHHLDFFLEIFYEDLFLFFFCMRSFSVINYIVQKVLPMHLQLISRIQVISTCSGMVLGS